MADEQEMLADLAAADAAGDTQLAQHIANVIKAGRVPPPDPTFKERLSEAAHKTAAFLPAAGGIVGGSIGAGLGGSIGAPTGPGAILTGAAGGGVGAGLLSAAGRTAQHMIDSWLGYEKPPTVVQAAKDALATGGKDAAYTTAGGVLLPMASAAAKPLGGPLNKLGNMIGRRVLTGGTHQLGVRPPVSDAALDEAFAQGAFKPLGTTQSAADTLAEARQAAGEEYAAVVKELEKAGVEGPKAEALATEYLQKAGNAQSNSLNRAVPRVYRSAANQLQDMAATPDTRLPLTRAENLKRSLQDMADSSYKKLEPNAVGQTQEDAASMMRQSVEDEIARQAQKAPAEAEAFIPVKQKFGRIAEAESAAREGAARAARRSPISLYDVLLATGGGAHGGLGEGLGALATSKALRTYGPSTATWALKAGSEALGGLDPAAAAKVGSGLGSLFGADSDPDSTDLQALLDAIKRRRSVPPDRNE